MTGISLSYSAPLEHT